MAKRKASGPKKATKSTGKRPAPDTKRADARHESGHAVAALVYEFPVFGIDIIPQEVPSSGRMMGKAGVDMGLPHLRTVVGRGERSVSRILVTLYAGFQAEKKVNPKAVLETGHPASDGDLARLYATCAIVPPVFEGGQYKTKAEHIDRSKDHIDAVLKRAEDASANLVEEHQAAIDRLADLLYEKGRLSGPEIVRFLISGA